MLMILVYYTLVGGCVDAVVNNRTNHQITSAIVAYFMNSAKVCLIIKRTAFYVYVCLNHSWRYEHKQFERCDEKSRHLRQFFSKFRHFLYLSVYVSLYSIYFSVHKTISFTTF